MTLTKETTPMANGTPGKGHDERIVISTGTPIQLGILITIIGTVALGSFWAARLESLATNLSEQVQELRTLYRERTDLIRSLDLRLGRIEHELDIKRPK